MRGDNPVLMTMELVLEVLGEEAAWQGERAGAVPRYGTSRVVGRLRSAHDRCQISERICVAFSRHEPPRLPGAPRHRSFCRRYRGQPRWYCVHDD